MIFVEIKKGTVICAKCDKWFHSICLVRVPGFRITGYQEIICNNCSDGERMPIEEKLAFYSKNNGLLCSMIMELFEKNDLLREKITFLEEKLDSKESKVSHAVIIPPKEQCEVSAVAGMGMTSQTHLPKTDVRNVEKNDRSFAQTVANLNQITVCAEVHTENDSKYRNTQKTKNNLKEDNLKTSYENVNNIKNNNNNHKNQISLSQVTNAVNSALVSIHEVDPTGTKGAKGDQSSNDEKNTDKGGKWNVVRNKGRSRQQYSNTVKTDLPRIPRPTPVKGSNDIFSLKVAERTSFLFLSGLHSSISADEVKNFIESNTHKKCSCEKMKTKSDHKKSSFKLEVLTEVRAQIMSPDLWGPGVIINHFLHLQRRPLETREAYGQEDQASK